MGTTVMGIILTEAKYRNIIRCAYLLSTKSAYIERAGPMASAGPGIPQGALSPVWGPADRDGSSRGSGA